MSIRTVQVGESDPLKLRVYFDVRLLDGTPATGEAGRQPEIGINSALYDATGIGVLVAGAGPGRYTAQLTGVAILEPGDIIQTHYIHSGVTLESWGNTFQVIDSDFTLANRSTTVLEYYGTLEDADRFYGFRIPRKSWERASSDYKIRALRMASRAIDRLNFSGDMVDARQSLQFPRSNTFDDVVTSDSAVPQAVIEAVYLCAPYFLEGWSVDMEINNLAAISNRVGPAGTQYDRSFVLPHLRAGIPSGEAWELLVGFLRDPHQVTLFRDS